MTKRTMSLFGASLALATGMFWTKVLIAPQVTEAATPRGVDPEQLSAIAGRALPSFDDRYQRHTGVLDTLKP